MSLLSIGIIEVVGLSNAIKIADDCVKSADVNLIGYELSKGGGLVVIKIEGDISSVKAAIEYCTRFSKVYSKKIIPRPDEGIDHLIKNKETIGYNDINDTENPLIQANQTEELEEINKQMEHTQQEGQEKDVELEQDYKYQEDTGQETEQIDKIDEEKVEKYTCNLCKDPKCPRVKGDLRVNCIHYADKDNK